MYCEHEPTRWNTKNKKGKQNAKRPANNTAKATKAASSKGSPTAIMKKPAKSSEEKLVRSRVWHK
eukprot:823772-Alexandrium_andersonii.AAC.1